MYSEREEKTSGIDGKLKITVMEKNSQKAKRRRKLRKRVSLVSIRKQRIL